MSVNAEIFKFSYLFDASSNGTAGHVLTGVVDGTLQSDGDTIVINELLSASLAGFAYEMTPAIRIRANNSTDAPKMSISGSKLDFWVCVNGFSQVAADGGGDCPFGNEGGFLVSDVYEIDGQAIGWAIAGIPQIEDLVNGNNRYRDIDIPINVSNWSAVSLGDLETYSFSYIFDASNRGTPGHALTGVVAGTLQPDGDTIVINQVLSASLGGFAYELTSGIGLRANNPAEAPQMSLYGKKLDFWVCVQGFSQVVADGGGDCPFGNEGGFLVSDVYEIDGQVTGWAIAGIPQIEDLVDGNNRYRDIDIPINVLNWRAASSVVEDFSATPGVDFFSFTDVSESVIYAQTTPDSAGIYAVPGEPGSNAVLTFDLPVSGFSGVGDSFFEPTNSGYADSQDWSGASSVSFWFYGEGNNNQFKLSLLDSNSADSGELWLNDFTDDVSGWKKVVLPLADFYFASYSTFNNGVFDTNTVYSWAILADGDGGVAAGTYYVDDIALTPSYLNDVDDDGVPDVDDAAPLDSEVGAFEPLLAEEVGGARVISTATSAILDPSFSTLNSAVGSTYEYSIDGTGTHTTRNGSMPLVWAVDARGVLNIELLPEPDDVSTSFPVASALPELGLATVESANAYIDVNGDMQVEVRTQPQSERWYVLPGGDNGEFSVYRETVSVLSLANDNDRIALQGDVNALPVTDASDELTPFLDLQEVPLISADIGADTPFGLDELLVKVVVDAGAIPGRRFSTDIIGFFPDGTGQLRRTGELLSWSYDVDGSVQIVLSGGTVISLRQLDTFSDTLGIYSVATLGDESYASYHIATPVVLAANDTSFLADLENQFLVSGFTLTSPDASDGDGNLALADVFGYELLPDGTARRVFSADPSFPGIDDWYWELRDGDIVLSARIDFSGQSAVAFSDCIVNQTDCMVFRERTWHAVAWTGSRLYIEESETYTNTFDPADPQLVISIAHRSNFYAYYTQDLDGDGLNDVIELFENTDPQIAQLDTDGDGISDVKEFTLGLDLFDPSDALLDPDLDGFNNVEEANSNSDPFDVNSQPANGTLEFAVSSNFIEEEKGSKVINVHRVLGAAGTVSVDYSVLGTPTAIENEDFMSTNGTLTWVPGDVSVKSFVVPIINDNEIEPAQLARLRLSNPGGGARLGMLDAVLTIIDDDYASDGKPENGVFLVGFSQRVSEAAGRVEIEVVRVGGSEGVVSVDVVLESTTSSIDISAELDLDYAGPIVTTLFWLDGDSDTKTLYVPIIDDEVAEQTEGFLVQLQNPTGGSAVLADGSDVQIIDDDSFGNAAGIVGVANRSFRFDEAEGSVDITLVRNQGNQGQVSVDVRTQSNTAVEGSDFVALTQTVTWLDGDEQPKTVTVPYLDDSEFEDIEVLLFVLGNVTGGAGLDRQAPFNASESYNVVIAFDYADVDLLIDSDNDGDVDAADLDDDDDGFRDYEDAFPLDASEQLDSDGD
ncbi:MAG: hypothetical protein ACJAVI_006136, partial [Candidatus Azotimanducaceae bacterium]